MDRISSVSSSAIGWIVNILGDRMDRQCLLTFVSMIAKMFIFGEATHGFTDFMNIGNPLFSRRIISPASFETGWRPPSSNKFGPLRGAADE